jgi:hypothetical protein
MIFNGIEIMFYLLGICTALGAYMMIRQAKKYKLLWFSWLLGIAAIFTSLFTIAWSWSSILEKEPQAAGMGLLVFGIPALILVFFTRKVVLKSEEKHIN